MMNWRIRCCLALSVFACLSVVAQNNQQPMTNADVVQMTKAGILAATVIHAIQTSRTAFDTSPEALTDLKKQGVADAVLDAILATRSGANHLPQQQGPLSSQQTHDSDQARPVALGGTGKQLEGVKVVDLPRELQQRLETLRQRDLEAGRYGNVTEFEGVLVTEVPKGSPADKAGLQPDDIVTALVNPNREDEGVNSAKAFYDLATGCAPDCLIRILYKSDYFGECLVSLGRCRTYLLVGPVGIDFSEYVNIKTRALTKYDFRTYTSKYKVVSSAGPAVLSRSRGPLIRTKQDFDEAFNLAILDGGIQVVYPGKPSDTNSQAVSGNDDIQQEIQKIRQGPHDAMPPAQQSQMALGGQSGMSVENGTQYGLTVFLSGPTGQKLEIPPGGSQVVRLLPGKYEVAARVSNPSVIPYYGEQEYPANTQALQHFYIAPR